MNNVFYMVLWTRAVHPVNEQKVQKTQEVNRKCVYPVCGCVKINEMKLKILG